jgi:hypothetical protein
MAAIVGVLIALGVGAFARASDLSPASRMPATAPAMLPPPPSYFWEARLGVTAHDPVSEEKGSADFNAELLIGKPYMRHDPLINFFIPRVHVGGSINTAGKTSYFYAGFTWNYDITPALFVEASFGGAIHDGNTSPIGIPGMNGLGCSPLFRESGAIGYRLNANWSVLVTIDHMSNAGLCEPNRGLTNVGGKISYRW